MIEIIGTISFVSCVLFYTYMIIGHILYFFNYITVFKKLYFEKSGFLFYICDFFMWVSMGAVIIDIVFSEDVSKVGFGLTLLPFALFVSITALSLIVLSYSFLSEKLNEVRENFPMR